MSNLNLDELKQIKFKQLQNNQVVITYANGDEAFYSYNRLIVLRVSIPEWADADGIKHWYNTYLNVNAWDYSRTTGKYRNIFLGETKRETEKKIKSGAYILKDLD